MAAKKKVLKLNGKHVVKLDMEKMIAERAKREPEFAKAYKEANARHARARVLNAGAPPGSKVCEFCGIAYGPGKGCAGLCLRHYHDKRNGRPMTLERKRAPNGQRRESSTSPVVAHVPNDLRAELDRHCDVEDLAISAVVTDALRLYFSRPV